MIESRGSTYVFSLVLAGLGEVTAEVEDALYVAGCDDALLAVQGGALVLEFERSAANLEAAVMSAIHDVVGSGIGVAVLRVEPDDLVNASDIARRAGVSREAVRLWIAGERGVGGFPPPLALLSKSSLWSWQEVASWMVASGLADDRSVTAARFFAAVNASLLGQRHAHLEADIERLRGKLARSGALRPLRASTFRLSDSGEA